MSTARSLERWAAFDRLAAQFVPVHPGFEAEAGRLKARFILLSNVVSSFLSLTLLVIYAACGLRWSFGGVLLYVVFSLIVPLLQKHGVPLRGLFTATFSLVLFAVAMAALTERPLTSGVLAWACIIPLTALGGEVSARSEPGIGSVFTVELPLPVREAPVAVLGAPREALTTRMDVLVVDDNAVNLRIAAALLTRAGCVVSQATNGQQAVELANARPFMAIFMDCQMPVLDGLAATRQLRANPLTASVPIIALTASAMADEVTACLDAGMNEVMAKPVTFEGIRASLERYAA